nr:hypothetical protein [Desulfobacteraceae bacterium]
MATIKIMSWNMEWMNDLFGPNDRPVAFKPDNANPAHNPNTTIKQRRESLSGVINELQPDVVLVVEGPNRTGELQLFFDTDVNGDWQTHVQYTKGQTQNNGIAVRTDTGKFDAVPITVFDTNDMPVFDAFTIDTDDDLIIETHKYERKPLYAELHPRPGDLFRLMGLHLKSKGIFGAYEWSKWWKIAEGNRKKLLAQATILRMKFLDNYLTAEETEDIPLIVAGDINDGPGLDAAEKRIFGSAMERLMGSIWKPHLCLGNAVFDSLAAKQQEQLDFKKVYSASFKDPIFNNVWQRDWIDHILYTRNGPANWVSAGTIHTRMASGRWMWEAYPHASDHFPITADINPGG